MTWLLVLSVFVLLLLAAKAEGVPMPLTYRTPRDKLAALALGTAQAEGWNVSGSLPQLANNPGGLRLYGETEGITHFFTPEEGWNQLYWQWDKILSGESLYYTVDMTFWQVAEVWTGGDNPAGWAATVSAYCGVPADLTLRQYVGL